MRKKTRFLVHAAIIAALYTVLTHLQNLIFPNSASMVIQFRASEALCVLAFFTPAAIPGLTIGCFAFNLLSHATPIDFLVGSLASLLAAASMWQLRKCTIKGYPLLGLLMPALSNALLVGYELTVYIGGSYPINAVYVALGELIVLYGLGSPLFMMLKKHSQRLFC